MGREFHPTTLPPHHPTTPPPHTPNAPCPMPHAQSLLPILSRTF
ncbi:MAG: hypothetical protein RMY29_026760 [Nostoc sp. CreGUA01]